MNFLIDEDPARGKVLTGFLRHKATVSSIALITALAAVQPAWATIDNTVTASGTAPGGTTVDATADEEVDVEDAAPAVTVTKVATDSGGATPSNAGVGDVITYTYTLTNDGNVTLSNVSFSDVHEGNGTLTQNDDEVVSGGGASTDASQGGGTQDGTWDSLAPGDTVTWTASYTVVQADITDNGGGDNDIDNTATFAATPAAGTIPPGDLEATEEVDLEDQNASLAVTKVADDDTDVVVGQTITYTYVVTNDGNVPITGVSLSDDVTAGSGPDPIPTFSSLTNTSGDSNNDDIDGDNNAIDVLAPGDSATFTGTYVVTQSDVDTLQ